MMESGLRLRRVRSRAPPRRYYSTAAACGAPARLGEGLLARLHFFAFTYSGDGALLRHFLTFYEKRGVRFKTKGKARIVASPAPDAATHGLLGEFLHPRNVRTAPVYSSHLKLRAANEYISALPEDGLLMYPDLDEFFDAPPALFDEAVRSADGFALGTMAARPSLVRPFGVPAVPSTSSSAAKNDRTRGRRRFRNVS